jgi:hypothetical protein
MLHHCTLWIDVYQTPFTTGASGNMSKTLCVLQYLQYKDIGNWKKQTFYEQHFCERAIILVAKCRNGLRGNDWNNSQTSHQPKAA